MRFGPTRRIAAVMALAGLFLAGCAGREPAPAPGPETYGPHSYKMAGPLTPWLDRTHGRPAN